jgi:hypothetical protein
MKARVSSGRKFSAATISFRSALRRDVGTLLVILDLDRSRDGIDEVLEAWRYF